MLIRCGEPSQYDHAPYGTVCKVAKSTSDEFEIYIQFSSDEAIPQWQKIGLFSPESLEQAIDEIVHRILGTK